MKKFVFMKHLKFNTVSLIPISFFDSSSIVKFSILINCSIIQFLQDNFCSSFHPSVYVSIHPFNRPVVFRHK